MSDDILEAGDSRQPKFGEWIRGNHASKDNPQRDGMYVQTIRRTGWMNPGKYYRLTDGKGSFWNYEAKETCFVRNAEKHQDEIERLTKERDEWKAASGNTVTANLKLFDENNKLESENASLTKELEEAKDVLLPIVAELSEAKAQLEVVKKERDKYEHKAGGIQSLKEEFDAMVEKYQEENASLKARLEESGGIKEIRIIRRAPDFTEIWVNGEKR